MDTILWTLDYGTQFSETPVSGRPCLQCTQTLNGSFFYGRGSAPADPSQKTRQPIHGTTKVLREDSLELGSIFHGTPRWRTSKSLTKVLVSCFCLIGDADIEELQAKSLNQQTLNP